jgi:hypothetical protein
MAHAEPREPTASTSAVPQQTIASAELHPEDVIAPSVKQSFWKWMLSAPTEKRAGWIHSTLSFLEHNFVILPAGIIGGIVALIFPPMFAVLGVCFLLGLHRSGAISGQSRLKQTLAYLLLAAISFVGLSRLNMVIQDKSAANNISFAKLVVSFFPKTPTIATESKPLPQPEPSRIPQASLVKSFSVSAGSYLMNDVIYPSFPGWGPYLVVACRNGVTLVPSDLTTMLNITNVSDRPASIESYSASILATDGRWHILDRISRAEGQKNMLFLVGDKTTGKQELTEMGRVQPIDEKLMKPLQGGDSVEGVEFFARREPIHFPVAGEKLRLRITERSGAQYDVPVRNLGSGAVSRGMAFDMFPRVENTFHVGHYFQDCAQPIK